MEHLSLLGADMEPVSNAKVFACIYYKKKIISYGFSQYKTHPFQLEYQKNEHAVYLHAEVDAIYKAKKRLSPQELTRSTLFICRHRTDTFKKEQFYGIAKPCSGCASCIDAHGIKDVYYSNTSDLLSYTYERYCA